MKNIESNFRYAKQVFRSLNYNGVKVDPSRWPDRTPYVVGDRNELKELDKLGKYLPDINELDDQQVSQGLFYIYYTYDNDAIPVLKRIAKLGGIFVAPAPTMMDKTQYVFGVNRLAHQAMMRTWDMSGRLSHLRQDVHENICEALEATKHLSGDYVEIGVYRGGSAQTAIHYLDELAASNQGTREVWLIDTFDGFNYQEAKDTVDPIWTDSHRLYGVEGTIKHIQQNLRHTQTSCKIAEKNICSEALPDEITAISVANIDVDMYEATLAAIQKVSPLMQKGGIIICEDPASTPALYGALLAMEEFLESTEGKNYAKIFKGAQYFLVRLA